MYGIDKKCDVCSEKIKGNFHLEDLNIDGRVTLKIVLLVTWLEGMYRWQAVVCTVMNIGFHEMLNIDWLNKY